MMEDMKPIISIISTVNRGILTPATFAFLARAMYARENAVLTASLSFL